MAMVVSRFIVMDYDKVTSTVHTGSHSERLFPRHATELCFVCSDFRGKGAVVLGMFPPHEFSEEEAINLVQFTSRICEEGYSFIEANLHGKVLNLAAEYGVFVSSEIGAWFLGVFLVAELLLSPSGQESYASSMVRSEVFSNAPQIVQEEAIILMLLIIASHRVDTATLRLEELNEWLRRKQKKEVSQIHFETAISTLSTGLSPLEPT